MVVNSKKSKITDFQHRCLSKSTDFTNRRAVAFYILFLVFLGYGELLDAGTRAKLLVSTKVPITHTSRTNTRYVDPTNGSDTNNGLTATTAWKTVAANVTRIPTDTEGVF